MFKDMFQSPKTIMQIGFFFLISLFIIIGLLFYREIHSISNLTKMIYNHPFVVSNSASSAETCFMRMHRSMKDVVLSNSEEQLAASINEITTHEKMAYQSLDIIKEKILGVEGQILEAQTRQLFADWKPIRQEVLNLFSEGNKLEAIAITRGKGADHVTKLENQIKQLTSYASNKADSFMHQAENLPEKVEKIILLLIIIGVALSLFTTNATIKKVTKIEHERERLIEELRKALDEIKTLRGILPICSFCKNIRNDEGFYEQIESYIHKHSGVDFSHTICPTCVKEHYPEEHKSIVSKKKI